jgi:hypothetical protein
MQTWRRFHHEMCARASLRPSLTLVLGDDDHLVWQVATALDLT